MLSSAEEELSEEVVALRALLHRERRARDYRSEVQKMLVETSNEIDPSGVADVIARGFTEIIESGWVCVAYPDPNVSDVIQIRFGPTMPERLKTGWSAARLSTDIPLAAVLRGDVVSVEMPDPSGFDRWPTFAKAAEEAGIGSFYGLPISGRQVDTASAVIGLAWPRPHRIDEDERMLLDDILVAAAPAFERARMSAVDRQVAETLQRWLLPPSIPDIDEVEIGMLYTPGRDELTVGGDWYEVIRIDASTTAIIVGDVVGHNVRAAAEMGQVRHVLASNLLSTGGDPAKSLDNTDAYFSQRAPDTMATAIVAVIQLDGSSVDGSLTICSAGHLPPILTEPGVASRLVEAQVGPPIGAGIGGYANVDRTLPPKSVLTAFTDGVVERRDEVIDDSLLSLCNDIDDAISIRAAGPTSVPSAVIVDVLQDRIGGGAGDDDAAALVVRRL